MTLQHMDALEFADSPASVVPPSSSAGAVLVPGDEVVTLHAVLPTRRRGRIHRALPYALEEQLLGDPAELHFALGAVTPEQHGVRVQAAVVDRARLATWLEALEGHGVTPSALVPDYLAITPVEGAFTLVGGAVLGARNGPRVGLRRVDGGSVLDGDPAALAAELGVVLDDVPPERRPSRLELQGLTEEQVTAARDVADARGLTVHVAEPAPLDPRAGIDLLQGEWRRGFRTGHGLRPLMPAAALAAVWVALQTGALAWEVHEAERARAALETDIETVFREAFPERRLVRPRVQMERALEEASGSAPAAAREGFPSLLLAAGRAVARGEETKLRRLHYVDRGLELELEFRSVEELEMLEERLVARGLDVLVHTASAVGEGVQARVSVRAEATT